MPKINHVIGSDKMPTLVPGLKINPLYADPIFTGLLKMNGNDVRRLKEGTK